VTAFEISSDAASRRDPHCCITCGDEGIVMRVVQVDEARGLALCETAGGERSTVEIALVDAGPGDDVLVHAGTAIA
jgi:hydrogenase expression/formation protein HypC